MSQVMDVSLPAATAGVNAHLRTTRQSSVKPDRVALHLIPALTGTRPSSREWEGPVDLSQDPNVPFLGQIVLALCRHVQRISVRSDGIAEPSVEELRRNAHDGRGPVRTYVYLAVFRNDALHRGLMGLVMRRTVERSQCASNVFLPLGVKKVNEETSIRMSAT